MKIPETHVLKSERNSKCPYHSVVSHIGRVRILFERILGKETPNVSVAWKWFQNEENLRKIREEKRAVWQDDGIDNRLAFAGLIGCVMPDFTAFIQTEANDFFTMKEAQEFAGKRFHIRMSNISKPKNLDTEEQIIDLDHKGRVAFSLFLLDVLFLWRGLWNKNVTKRIKKNKDEKIAFWKLAFILCSDAPTVEKDKGSRGKKTIKRERNALGIGQPLGGGMTTLASEFMRAIERQEIYNYRTLTNDEIDTILPQIHIGLLEIMHEFTGFTFVASHIRNELEKLDPALNLYEKMRSGDISFTGEFFMFLEKNFMAAYTFLRGSNKIKKDLGTMTCPVTRSEIAGKNVISILPEVLIIPLIRKYYLPWRAENIPGATINGNPET